MEHDEDEEFASASEGEDLSRISDDEKVLETPKQAESRSSDQTAQSWTGWGSWLGSAVNAVQESFQDDVNSLLNTAKNIGDTVYETLDGPVIDTSSQEKSNQSTKQAIPTGNLLQSTEVVLGSVDKALDFTSDILGNAVLESYRSIENARLGEKIKDLNQSDVLTNSKEVGHTVIRNGLTALEAIGTVVGNQAARRLAESKDSREPKKTESAVKDWTIEDQFEDNCGMAHLEALEMLAAECSLKVKGRGKALNAKALPIFRKLQREFDFEESIEEALETEESTLSSTEGFQHFCSLMESIGVSNRKPTENLQSMLNDCIFQVENMRDEMLESMEGDLIHSREDFNLILSSKHQLLKTTFLTKISNIAEKICELILRIAEIFLMAIAEDRLDHENNEDVSSRQTTYQEYSPIIKELAQIFFSELQYFSVKYNRTCQQIYSRWNDTIQKSDLLTEVENDSLHSLNDRNTKEISSSIDCNLSKIMEYVQEGLSHLLPILKLMVISKMELKE